MTEEFRRLVLSSSKLKERTKLQHDVISAEGSEEDMTNKKMKATMKNGRARKGETYNPNHNTLEYVRIQQPHIDQTRLKDNYYFKFDGDQNATTIRGGSGGFDSKKHEMRLYEELYRDGLNARNERYIKNRHKERCRTVQDLYTDPKTAPLETIYQLGKVSSEMDPKERGSILLKAWRDFTKEILATYGEWLKPLDGAYHAEEQSRHVHFRMTIGAKDQYGHFVPNQSLALQQMGFDRPDLTRKQDRYNNPLISFTDYCRERFYHHCERYGIEIDREVTSHSRREYELEQLRIDQMKQEREAEKRKLDQTRQTVKIEEQLLNEAHKDVSVRRYGTVEAEPEKKGLSGKIKEEAKPHRTIVATDDLEELQRQATYNRVQEYKIKTIEQIERAMERDQEIQKLKKELSNEQSRANSLQIELNKSETKRNKAEGFIKDKHLERAYESHLQELNQDITHKGR